MSLEFISPRSNKLRNVGKILTWDNSKRIHRSRLYNLLVKYLSRREFELELQKTKIHRFVKEVLDIADSLKEEEQLDLIVKLLLHLDYSTAISKLSFTLWWRIPNFVTNLDGVGKFIEIMRKKDLLFPERHSNIYLSPKDKEKIDKVYRLEYASKYNFWVLLKEEKDNYCVETKEDEKMYSKCYRNICIMEHPKRRKQLETLELVQDIITIEEPQEIGKVSYCMSIKNFIEIISTTGINPYTQEKFDEKILSMYRRIFITEIRMFLGFLSRLGPEGTMNTYRREGIPDIERAEENLLLEDRVDVMDKVKSLKSILTI